MNEVSFEISSFDRRAIIGVRDALGMIWKDSKSIARAALVTVREWKPAIHLDNRYRLMRKEPMLDANGMETNEIGDDGYIDMEEEMKKMHGKQGF
ncbi:hypothetical protein KM043_006246 [Ampulex compressa]|nr:hypothetical protein KM043_006246 [Ampulex compressa]